MIDEAHESRTNLARGVTMCSKRIDCSDRAHETQKRGLIPLERDGKAALDDPAEAPWRPGSPWSLPARASAFSSTVCEGWWRSPPVSTRRLRLFATWPWRHCRYDEFQRYWRNRTKLKRCSWGNDNTRSRCQRNNLVRLKSFTPDLPLTLNAIPNLLDASMAHSGGGLSGRQSAMTQATGAAGAQQPDL